MTFINDSAILWYTAVAGEKGKNEEVSRGCLEDRSTENDPAVAKLVRRSRRVMSHSRSRQPVVLTSFRQASLDTYLNEWRSIRASRVISQEDQSDQDESK